ncbi:MAG TPA: DUF2339 domain-containing protein [Granulicella sp.]|jgi:uncharacterized membrane protein|nr:DUF2339 domain-containing protein [Granulicella sp.]
MPDPDAPIPNPGIPVPGQGPDPAAQIAAQIAAKVAALEARIERLEQILATQLPAQVSAATPPPPRPPHIQPARSKAAPPKDSFEERLGSQIFNRVGILALLLGATWFLRLAMDNHWIGPLGRVLVGLLAGAALMLWSERFRRQNVIAFSYSLKAIGSGVLYLSLWAAFQLYQLLPAPAAFLLMLVVTAWNAFMALSPGDPSQASELLAVYALAGAFATPLLLSTGINHQAFLFSYLLAIDLATVLLVRLRQSQSQPWPRPLLIALLSTIAYFIAWFVDFYSPAQLVSTSIFLALFFFTFLTVPLAPELPVTCLPSDPQQDGAGQGSDHPVPAQLAAISDILLPLANAAFASLALYSILEDAGHHAALPWFSLLFAALYLTVLRLPQRAAARAIHLSLAVVFLTITVPLKASGAAIPLAWLAEAVSLFWAASRFEAATSSSVEADPLPRALRLLATGALILGFLGLLLHPLWIGPLPTTAFLNRRFATALAGILAFAASAAIARAALHRPSGPAASHTAWFQIAAASIIALNLVALQAGVLEIETFWYPASGYAPYSDAPLQTALSISAFFALYGAALLAVGFLRRSAFLRWQALILLQLAIAKTFLYDVRNLSQGYRVVSFLGLGALLMAISFAYQKDWLSLRANSSATIQSSED